MRKSLRPAANGLICLGIGVLYQQVLVYAMNAPQMLWQYFAEALVRNATDLAIFSTIWNVVISALLSLLVALLVTRLRPYHQVIFTLLLILPIAAERGFGFLFWRSFESINYWQNFVQALAAVLLPAVIVIMFMRNTKAN